MADGPLGTYVYCVLPGDANPSLEDVRGMDPRHQLHVVRGGGLAALVSSVSLDEFGAEPLKRNLNDLQWLERTARTHQGVLDRALAASTIVPLRLCTVYNDDESVRGMLEREHDVLAAALARLTGRQEWGLKLTADPRALRESVRRPRDAASQAPGAGLAYVARLKQDRVARDDAQRVALEAARAIHRGLAAQAAAAKILRKPARELSTDTGELVLNAAYLVDRDRAEEFRALATELGERHCPRGMRVEVTGPWPPHSFVAEPTDERRPSRAGLR